MSAIYTPPPAEATAHRGPPELRLYQTTSIAAINAALGAGHRRVVFVLPTGGGKAVIAAALIKDAVAAGLRVLVIVHRRELVRQQSNKLFALGIDHGIISADFPPRPGEPVQIASIQTLFARAVRSAAMSLPIADLVVVDETHHATARTWRRIIDSYPMAQIVGMTATPCRSDGRGLGSIFDTKVEGPKISELISLGFLTPTKVYAPSRADLEGIQTRAGEFVNEQLEKRFNRPKLVGDIVTTWLKLAERKTTIVFAISVAHAAHIRDEFRRAGVLAEMIDGTTPTDERDRILEQLGAGQVEVVVNVGVLTEGVDVPSVACVVLGRPTRSLPLYFQCVGRGLRPAPGKTETLVIDHAGATLMHGFIDDDVEWTLSESARAENRRQTERSQGRTPKLVDCPECHLIKMQGKPCSCGWRPRPKPQRVDFVDGDLGEVDRSRTVRKVDPTAEQRAQFHRELVAIAREKGYQLGWCAHKFKERYGTWPETRHVSPATPSDATRAWVRSRAIAYAKGRSKAGAA